MLTDLPDTLASLIMPRFHGEALAAVNALIEAERLATVDQLKAHIDQFMAKQTNKQTADKHRRTRVYTNPAWRPQNHASFMASFRKAHPDGERVLADVIYSYPAGAMFPNEAYDRLKASLGITGKKSVLLTAALRDLGCTRDSGHRWYTPVLRRGVA